MSWISKFLIFLPIFTFSENLLAAGLYCYGPNKHLEITNMMPGVKATLVDAQQLRLRDEAYVRGNLARLAGVTNEDGTPLVDSDMESLIVTSARESSPSNQLDECILPQTCVFTAIPQRIRLASGEWGTINRLATCTSGERFIKGFDARESDGRATDNDGFYNIESDIFTVYQEESTNDSGETINKIVINCKIKSGGSKRITFNNGNNRCTNEIPSEIIEDFRNSFN